MMLYDCSVGYEKQRDEFLNKLEQIMPSFPMKKTNFYTKKQISKKMEFSLDCFVEKKALNFFYGLNYCEKLINPRLFLKFDCSFISDVCLVSHNFLDLFINKFPKNRNKKLFWSNNNLQIVLAFVGCDGYFRMYDFNTLEPLLCFKSDFGGYNSCIFSESKEFVALGGQDDCATILDLNTLNYIKIKKHNSFISKIAFQEFTVNKNILRIVCVSLDCCISITEIEKTIFDHLESEFQIEKPLDHKHLVESLLEERTFSIYRKGSFHFIDDYFSKEIKNNSSHIENNLLNSNLNASVILEKRNSVNSKKKEFAKPIYIAFQEEEAIFVEPNFYLQISECGINRIEINGSLLVVSGFDGRVVVWNIEDCLQDENNEIFKKGIVIEENIISKIKNSKRKRNFERTPRLKKTQKNSKINNNHNIDYQNLIKSFRFMQK